MISSKLFLVADRVIKDSETNNLSIINILDDITAEAYPLIIHKLTIVSFVTKEREEDKVSLGFKILNNDTKIIEHQIKVDFRGKNKTRAIIQLGVLPIQEAGQIHFILTDEQGNEIDRYSINLRLREEIKVITE